MRFIHCSDVHLGRVPSSGSSALNTERYRDYFRAFSRIIEKTIEEKADCLVIAGDLFHYGSIKPSALADAVELLEVLKAKNIPVIAIEGNHDRFCRRKDESWLLYLSRMKYLKLLRPSEDPVSGTIGFEPFDEEKGWGGWTEVEGIKFYGLGYWGHEVAKQLERAAKCLNEKTDVALLHAGVWNIPTIEIGRVSKEEFRPLAKYFRYVALGHGHMKYEVDDEEGNIFGYNPGAVEIVNREEAEREDSSEGRAYIVDIDKDNLHVKPLSIKRRPYLNIRVPIDGASNKAEAVELIERYLQERKKALSPQEPPLIHLDIEGAVDFNPMELEPHECESVACEIFSPVFIQTQNRAYRIRMSGGMEESSGIGDIFKKAVTDLIIESPEYAEYSGEISDLIMAIDTEAGEKASIDDDKFADLIHSRRLYFMKEKSDDESQGEDQPDKAEEYKVV